MAGASEPVPSGEDEEGHEEEAVSEQRLTLDLVDRVRVFRTARD